MRQFLYNLATKLHAPLSVRAMLQPSEATALVPMSGRISDPVEVFRKELGLTKSKRQTSWTKQLIAVTQEVANNRVVVGLFACTVFLANFKFVEEIVKHDATLLAVLSYFGAIVGMVISIIGGLIFFFSKTSSHSDRRGFLKLLGVYLGFYCVWAVFIPLPLPGKGALSVAGVFWVLLSVLAFRKLSVPQVRQSTEEEVKILFDQFVAEQRPDVLEDESTLNRELSALRLKIDKAKDVLAKFKGELQAETERGGSRLQSLNETVLELGSRIADLERELEVLQIKRDEVVSALQVFESLKGDAMASVRIHDLELAADEVLGEGRKHADRAEAELIAITEKIRSGMERLLGAVQALQITALPGMEEGGSVNALYSGAEEVGAKTVRVERMLRRLK